MKQVVLAMTESDAHVVGNKLLEVFLQESGFIVNNRGACTPLREVFKVAYEKPTLAIVLCSQNGHALEDIEDLRKFQADYKVACPVILGGNLSVGANKASDLHKKFKAAGIDYITSEFNELKEILEHIELETKQQEVIYA